MVAFTAFATMDRTYDNETPMLFQGVKENIDDFYNSTISQLTCPVDGVYFFSVTVSTPSSHGETGRVRLMQEKRLIVTANAAFSEAFEYESGSTSAIAYCAAGERLWVKTADPSTISNEQRRFDGNGYARSSFSGVLIKAG